MRTEKLNSLEKNIIKLEIKQALLSFLALGIIAIVVVSSLILYLLRSESLHLQKEFAITFIICVATAGLLGYVYLSVKDYLADLRSGLKNSYTGLITEKSTNSKYGWHGNPAADATTQPKLDEFLIVIGNQKVWVPEDVFNKLVIGDNIKVCFSSKSNILLGIIKE